jgi:ergothioneine biosynthesis protein EgtB
MIASPLTQETVLTQGPTAASCLPGDGQLDRLLAVRRLSVQLCEGLEPEDLVAQSMPDASPLKWHLAHTTWFFETFVLRPHLPGYEVFHPGFAELFNSYYVGAGPRYLRAARGMLTRPPLRTVLQYRGHVEGALRRLFEQPGARDPALHELVELGLHHEQQHQELMLTDLLHLFSFNPLKPAWRQLAALPRQGVRPLAWLEHPGGPDTLGFDGEGFHFDLEAPRHTVWLQAHALADRAVCNAEFSEFVRDGGYRNPLLWLSDGWAAVQREQWRAPLYWSEDGQSQFTLGGECDIDPAAPACHLSYFEADAFARWAGCRLPTEAEWEARARGQAIEGNLLDSGRFRPAPATQGTQCFGDVWEWCASAFLAYPGFKPAAGAVGEYNGKFMSGQMVLRGGSCVTPRAHLRPSYRNFFYPHQRWQFMGLRLAKDLE